MLNVTAGTFRCERLGSLVQWRIVTCETSLIGYLCLKSAVDGYVAKRALFRKYRVSTREWTARVHFLSALRALRQKPAQRNRGNANR